MTEPIIIRRSKNQDRVAILDLSDLDSRRAPEGEALLAFVGGELRAALPLDGGEPVADPFHRTADIVDLLRVRADHLEPRRSSRARLASLRLRAA